MTQLSMWLQFDCSTIVAAVALVIVAWLWVAEDILEACQESEGYRPLVGWLVVFVGWSVFAMWVVVRLLQLADRGGCI